MKKVVLIHGFAGSPNGGWRPWLMGELERKDIYAVSLPMPNPEEPNVRQWIETISNFVEENPNDEIYLVGHSLGGAAILRYLENINKSFPGIVLVSSPSHNLNRKELSNFFDPVFDYKKIKNTCKNFVVIHGSNDDRVPFSHAEKISTELNAKLISIENGGHLNGSSGWIKLPQCLEELNILFNIES